MIKEVIYFKKDERIKIEYYLNGKKKRKTTICGGKDDKVITWDEAGNRSVS
jgi:antitoxin component YwqK of YwqJK toxin-antitoxin module